MSNVAEQSPWSHALGPNVAEQSPWSNLNINLAEQSSLNLTNCVSSINKNMQLGETNIRTHKNLNFLFISNERTNLLFI